jgi:hypothetical protein
VPRLKKARGVASVVLFKQVVNQYNLSNTLIFAHSGLRS